MRMVPNSKTEWAELPHVILTSGADWDPKVLDHTVSDTDNWYNTIKEMNDGLIETPFDQFGNYRHREPTTNVQVIPDQAAHNDFEISFTKHSHWHRTKTKGTCAMNTVRTPSTLRQLLEKSRRNPSIMTSIDITFFMYRRKRSERRFKIQPSLLRISCPDTVLSRQSSPRFPHITHGDETNQLHLTRHTRVRLLD